jgi:hypothetical protein
MGESGLRLVVWRAIKQTLALFFSSSLLLLFLLALWAGTAMKQGTIVVVLQVSRRKVVG